MTDHIPLNHPARATIIAQLGQRTGGKQPKYRNEKAMVDGIVFASKREARRYQELRLEEKAGEIADLRLQVRYLLTINGVQICHYVADFVYQRDGQTVVEDAKGFRNRVYLLKRSLMLALHGINIVET